MQKTIAAAVACLALGGCITNNVTSTANPNIGQSLHASQGMAAIQGSQFGAAAPPPASQPSGPPRVTTVDKTVLSGETIRLAEPMSLNPDCSSAGRARGTIVTQPAHGALLIEDGMAFPTYPASDPRGHCDQRKVPALVISYRADAGYKGTDMGAVELLFASGNTATVRFNLTVR